MPIDLDTARGMSREDLRQYPVHELSKAVLNAHAASEKAEAERRRLLTVCDGRPPTENQKRAISEAIETRVEMSALGERLHAVADEASKRSIAEYVDQNPNTVDYRQVIQTSGADESRGYDQQGRHTGGGHVYRANDSQTSWLRDLMQMTITGDTASRDRLLRNNNEWAIENRALATNVSGSVSEFVPPLHLHNELIEVARPRRVFADQMTLRPLPANAMAIETPRMATGAAVGTQANENTAVTEQEVTAEVIRSTVRTIAGQQTLSFQLVDQSPIPMDEIILRDLTRDLAVKVDQFCLTSNSTGQLGVLNVPGTNVVSYSDTTPTPGELYPKWADCIQRISTSRYEPPNRAFVHPRRWAWMQSALDSSGRPLAIPASQMPQNALAAVGGVVAEGLVGQMQGIPIFADPSIPVNNTVGASGGHQDVIIMAVTPDMYLFESAAHVIVDRNSLSNQLSMRLVMWKYVMIQFDRYPDSIGLIQGTGLEAPTF